MEVGELHFVCVVWNEMRVNVQRQILVVGMPPVQLQVFQPRFFFAFSSRARDRIFLIVQVPAWLKPPLQEFVINQKGALSFVIDKERAGGQVSGEILSVAQM